MTNHRTATTARDEGVAMVIAMIWGFAMLVLALIVGQSVLNLVRPSDAAERSFQAWAAAEAGVEDLRARLIAAEGGDISGPTSAATNPALTGLRPIPGGSSADTTFTYNVDTNRAAAAGRVVVTSTGRAGDQVRTVEAQLQKRLMYDYAYASMYETIPSTFPDYWSGTGQFLTRAEGTQYCMNRYWYQTGANPDTTANPNHRQSNRCLSGETTNFAIGGTFYKFVGGPVHTNDVFTFRTNASNALDFNPRTTFEYGVTSSCPVSVTGLQVGCPSNHRWIANNVISNSTGYITDETFGPPVSGTPTWEVGYESQLEIRHEGLAVMKKRALEAGCVFTGPTRLKFFADGTVLVTSPNSVDPDPTGVPDPTNTSQTVTRNAAVNCGGAQLKGSASSPTVVRSVALGTDDLPTAAFNGVIYVQNAPAASDPAGGWSTPLPSCADKQAAINGHQPFPYVVLGRDPVEGKTDVFMPSSTGLKGFPGATTNPTGQRETFATDPDGGNSAETATDGSCGKAVVYVEGEYKGKWSIVSDYDIIFTSDLIDANVPVGKKPVRTTSTVTVPTGTLPADWGVPPSTSTNAMGLVPDRMLYIYGCSPERGCASSEFNREARVGSLVVNASTVITRGCLTVMDRTPTGGSWGQLTFVGSLGQMYRCPIEKNSGSGGFEGMRIVYDARFKTMEPPPYIAALSNEPWRILKIEEVNGHITRP